jgi:hypothetical protein
VNKNEVYKALGALESIITAHDDIFLLEKLKILSKYVDDSSFHVATLPNIKLTCEDKITRCHFNDGEHRWYDGKCDYCGKKQFESTK